MKENSRAFGCRGIFAGLMIGIGCTVYLACPNKLVGAFMFSAGLFFILSCGGALLTGLCGLKTPWKTLGLALGFNTLGALLTGLLTWPSGRLAQPAAELMAGKLAANLFSWLANGMLCGMLVYLAVEGYKRCRDGLTGLASVLYGVPAFIVAGFEHSIADIGYFAIALPALSAGQIVKSVLMIIVVIAGNVLGSKLLRKILVDWQQPQK